MLSCLLGSRYDVTSMWYWFWDNWAIFSTIDCPPELLPFLERDLWSLQKVNIIFCVNLISASYEVSTFHLNSFTFAPSSSFASNPRLNVDQELTSKLQQIRQYSTLQQYRCPPIDKRGSISAYVFISQRPLVTMVELSRCDDVVQWRPFSSKKF